MNNKPSDKDPLYFYADLVHEHLFKIYWFFYKIKDIFFISLIYAKTVDPHIFPDPGRQNDADPTDMDPTHCLALIFNINDRRWL